MSLANGLGIFFGLVLAIHGLFGKGSGYNDVEAPLREEERNNPFKPFTQWGRVSFIGFGILLVVLGIMGRFNM